MKTIIYYFTGTGNSLAAAKKIAEIIKDCELVSVASLKDTPEIIPAAKRVGIIFPVYFAGLPVMVSEFAGRLNLQNAEYTFGLATLGGTGGKSALRQLDKILKKKNSKGLDAGFAVLMPSNYILLYNPPAKDKQEIILAKAEERLCIIAENIADLKKQKIPVPILDNILHLMAYRRFASNVHKSDYKFSAGTMCTSCGLCAEICPAGNIELIDGKPLWKHHCEMCCGCIHICPAGAIEAGPKTAGRNRLINPSFEVSELKQKKNQIRQK